MMRVVSHRTLALYASVGLGLQPQLPSAPPLPHPLWSGPRVAGAAEERLPDAPLPALLSTVGSLWVGENLVSFSRLFTLLLFSPAQHLVLTETQASVVSVVHASGRLEGRMKKEPWELP